MSLHRVSSQQSLADLCSRGPALEISAVGPIRFNRERLRKNRAHVKVRGSLSKTLKKSKSFLSKFLKNSCKEKQSSKNTGSQKQLMLLNAVAALYGLGNVLSKFVETTGPGAPESLNSAVKYFSASLVFLPVLIRCFKSKVDRKDLIAGLELGLWTFVHSALTSYSPTNTELNVTSLLYAVTAFGVPIMKLHAGRSSAVTWLAIATALSGMGVLEEEGSGWKGIHLPSLENGWVLLNSTFTLLQLLRSEALAKKHNPANLNAAQLVVLSVLNLLQELNHLDSLTGLIREAQMVPWCPLVFSGIVCAGLASLLEMRGLRGINGSAIAIGHLMVPIWGAFFSLMEQHRPLQDIGLISGMVLMFARLCGCLSGRLQNHGKSEKTEQVQNSHASHLPVVILACQLKYPYYAKQAQSLISDMDSNISSGLLTLQTAVSSDEKASLLNQSQAVNPNEVVQSPAVSCINDLFPVGDTVHMVISLTSSLDTFVAAWNVNTAHSLDSLTQQFWSN